LAATAQAAPSVGIAPAQAAPGATLRAVASDLMPNTHHEVWLRGSTNVRLAAATANGAGDFTVSLPLPADTQPGAYRIELRDAVTAITDTPLQILRTLDVTVVPGSTPPQQGRTLVLDVQQVDLPGLLSV